MVERVEKDARIQLIEYPSWFDHVPSVRRGKESGEKSRTTPSFTMGWRRSSSVVIRRSGVKWNHRPLLKDRSGRRRSREKRKGVSKGRCTSYSHHRVDGRRPEADAKRWGWIDRKEEKREGNTGRIGVDRSFRSHCVHMASLHMEWSHQAFHPRPTLHPHRRQRHHR